MKITVKVLQYLWRNIFKIIPFTFFPSIVLGFNKKLSNFLLFFISENFDCGNLWDVYQVFSFFSEMNFLKAVISLLSLLLFVCLLVAAIDRHLKVGKFSFTKPFTKINDNILNVAPVLGIFLASFEIAGFLNSVIIVLLNLMFPGAIRIIAVFTTVFMYVGLLVLIMQFVFWVPSMVVVGYNLEDACIYSTKLTTGKTFHIALNFGVLCLFSVLVSGLMFVFLRDYTAIIDIVVYNVVIAFSVCYMMVGYFESTNEPRKDLENKSRNYLI